MKTNLTVTDGQAGQPGLLNKEQLAARLGVNKRTVDRLMARGLPHYKLGYKLTRFDWCATCSWLDDNFRVSARA